MPLVFDHNFDPALYACHANSDTLHIQTVLILCLLPGSMHVILRLIIVISQYEWN